MNKPTENWKGKKWILNLKLFKTGLNWFGRCEGCVQCSAVYILLTPEMREGTSPLHPLTLFRSLLGDLPPWRLHTRLHAGEIPNLVSRNCAFLCELPRLVDSPVRVHARAKGVCAGPRAAVALPRQSLDQLVVSPLVIWWCRLSPRTSATSWRGGN